MRKSITLLVFAYVLLVLNIALLLGPAMVGDDRLAFRDASHFYTPLYEYVAHRQREVWVPLWNPLDLTGLPLAGETSTAVFYPVRMLVYALTPTPETALAWYVAVHLIIAAICIHVAAKSAGAGPLGCAIAVIAYPLAGPIFFLIYNPPFLVGAAWMPLALAATFKLLRMPCLKWILIAAVALSLIILGGDPQTVVHVILITSTVACCGLRKTNDGAMRPSVRSVGSLAIACLLAGMLTAPQLAASVDWSMQSGRITGGETSDRYDFSIQPWHWVELIVPHASGHLFPVNTRISQTLRGDDRTWIVTLFSGTLVLILCCHRCTTTHPKDWNAWDWLAPAGLFFSIAGPYWILSLIPGYESFRYPAKWSTLVPLGLVIVASRELDQLVVDGGKRFASICLVICLAIILIATSCAFLAILGRLLGIDQPINTLGIVDRFWGPLQPNAALTTAIVSALGTVLFASATWGLLHAVRRFAGTSSQYAVFAGIIGLVAIESFVVASPQVALVSIASEAAVTQEIAKASNPTSTKGYRTLRTSGESQWPQQWSMVSSDDRRILEVEASQRATAFGRWHLTNRSAIFNSVTTLMPQRIESFWQAVKINKSLHKSSEAAMSWGRLRSWLGIDRVYTVSSPMEHSIGASTIVTSHFETSIQPEPSPVVRWHSRWQAIEPQRSVATQQMAARLDGVIRDDASNLVIVEDASLLDAAMLDTSVAPSSAIVPTIEVRSLAEERMSFEVGTTGVGLLVVTTLQDGNWYVTVTPAGSPTDSGESRKAFKADYLFMGTILEPGRWNVTFAYQPWWLFPAFTMQLTGALLGFGGLIMILVNASRSQLVKRHAAQ
jgi:hypothetical protein